MDVPLDSEKLAGEPLTLSRALNVSLVEETSHSSVHSSLFKTGKNFSPILRLRY